MKKLILLSFIISLSLSSLQVEAQLSKKAQFQTLYQKKMEKMEQQFKAIDPKSQMKLASVQGNPLNSEDYLWFEEDWLHTSNTAFTYNEKGNTLEQVTTDANTGDGLYKYSYDFDSHDNQVQFIYYSWVDGDWQIQFGFSSVNTYDEAGNIIEQLSQFYNSDLMEWVNSSRYMTVYDDGENLLEEIYQYWTGDSWQNDFKQVYTVDEQGVWTSVTGYMSNGENWVGFFRVIDLVWQDWENWIESSETYQEWMDEMWVDVQKFSTEFNDNGFVRIYETNDNGEWALMSRLTYTETSPEHVYLYENYVSGGWVNSERDTEFYDEYQNFAGFKFELADADSWIIVFYFANINTYNENGDITEMVYLYWDDQAQMLVNSEKHVYSNFLTRIGEYVSGLDMNLFPNPVENVLEINAVGGLPEFTRFKLVDMNGRVVQEGQLLSGKQSLDMSNLRTGMYFLNVNTPDNLNSSFKVLKK